MLEKDRQVKTYNIGMKNIKIIFTALCAVAFFSACGGDHNAKNGQDTIKNTYHVARDSSKADTSVSSSTDLDNSASGGTKVKDTTGAKKDSSKK
jgi:hypothetical protein